MAWHDDDDDGDDDGDDDDGDDDIDNTLWNQMAWHGAWLRPSLGRDNWLCVGRAIILGWELQWVLLY